MRRRKEGKKRREEKGRKEVKDEEKKNEGEMHFSIPPSFSILSRREIVRGSLQRERERIMEVCGAVKCVDLRKGARKYNEGPRERK